MLLKALIFRQDTELILIKSTALEIAGDISFSTCASAIFALEFVCNKNK